MAKHKRGVRMIKSKTRRNLRAKLLELQENKCHWCKREFNEERLSTFEHLIPLGQGGTNARENLVLACAPCNEGRGNSIYPPRITNYGS